MNLKTFCEIQLKFEAALEALREIPTALMDAGYAKGSRDECATTGAYFLLESQYNAWMEETRRAFGADWLRDSETKGGEIKL